MKSEIQIPRFVPTIIVPRFLLNGAEHVVFGFQLSDLDFSYYIEFTFLKIYPIQ